jgi:hypothetical protein
MSDKKDCGCSKKKKEKMEAKFRVEATESPDGTKTTIRKNLGLVQSFATSVASRGLTNKKTTKPTKQLRVLGCFGNQHVGGELPPCEHLRTSKTEGKYYCGGCGCGDSSRTWLVADDDEYSKLDYPKLNCPLNMPGFTNYKPSNPEEAVSPITRRYYIENMDYKELLRTKVTTPEEPVIDDDLEDLEV